MSITSVVLYFALVYVISSLPGLSGKETSRRGVNRWCKFPSCRPHPHYWILVGFLKGGGGVEWEGASLESVGFCYQRQQYLIVWNPSLFRSALVQHWYLLFLWFASRTLHSFFQDCIPPSIAFYIIASLTFFVVKLDHFRWGLRWCCWPCNGPWPLHLCEWRRKDVSRKDRKDLVVLSL